jgi:hypothetical protein
MAAGVGPLNSVPKFQGEPKSAEPVIFTGTEELLEVKLIVFVILGPFCGEVTVIDVGFAIKVTGGVVDGVMIKVTGI